MHQSLKRSLPVSKAMSYGIIAKYALGASVSLSKDNNCIVRAPRGAYLEKVLVTKCDPPRIKPHQYNFQ